MTMRIRTLPLTALAFALLATAGAIAEDAVKPASKPPEASDKARVAQDDADSTPVPADITVQRTPAPTLLADTTGVRLEGYDSGTVYANTRGLTLYIYDRDSRSGVSSCIGDCARTWRPLPAPGVAGTVGDWTVVVDAADATRQWAYKGKPVYTYVGDVNPGDTLGDGKDGVWHQLVEHQPFRLAEIKVGAVEGRPVLTDANGLTLYTFDGDENLGPDFTLDQALEKGLLPKQVGHCIKACAQTWRAVLAPADAKPPKGDWTVVERVDDPSKKQWAFRKYPLYTYVGDTKPGEANGVDNKYGPDYAFSTMFRLASTETGRF
jgi:predicted lipoprotein with Yx(FWY)xxD motif